MPCYELTPYSVNGLRDLSCHLLQRFSAEKISYEPSLERRRKEIYVK
jgi:hypothetical protein